MFNFVEQLIAIFMLSDCQGVNKQIITDDEFWMYAYDPEIISFKRRGQTKKAEIGGIFLRGTM